MIFIVMIIELMLTIMSSLISIYKRGECVCVYHLSVDIFIHSIFFLCVYTNYIVNVNVNIFIYLHLCVYIEKRLETILRMIIFLLFK